MAIPKLVPALDSEGKEITIDIQQTSLALDILSQFVCNTWEEATADPDGIDVVVIGGGMYGGYCASKIYELSRLRFGADEHDKMKALRVLVLDAGPFLVPEHSQNIPNLGLPTPSVFTPKSIQSGTNIGTTNIVWGFGWRSNKSYSEQAYCVGGKGVYWGGWCPRLQPVDLVQWPEEVRRYLTEVNEQKPVGTRPIDHRDQATNAKLRRGEPLSAYGALEYEIGVVPQDDFVFDPANICQDSEAQIGLNGAVRIFLDSQKAAIDDRITEVIPAPIAVQTQSFISGLFALDKYSSVPTITASARTDHGDGRTKNFRFSVVPFTHVVRLECAPAGEENPAVGTRLVDRIVVKNGGEVKILKIGSHCQVVLALSCIESTRLALESFSLESSLLRKPGDELIGRNFMVHLCSDITFKVERTKFEEFVNTHWGGEKKLVEILQLASLHIQCEGQRGTYQYQLYAATNQDGPDDNMYRMAPELDIQRQIASGFDDASISFVLRSSGEVKGGRDHPVGDPNFHFIDMAGDADYDKEFGHKRAWVQFQSDGSGNTADPIWADMHDTAHAIAKALANGGKLEYDGDFTLPSFSTQQGPGTSWHDSGTLWMGDDPATSVTDVNGHFHHVTNAYCADQALFTTVGSANPVLTGLCLARKVADDIVSKHSSYKATPAELNGFTSLSLDPNNGWLTTPYNGIQIINKEIIETKPDDGIGIYYLPLEYENFELHVEWKAFRTPVFPNAGVLLRMPDPQTVDFRDKAQAAAFYNTVIEVQIDDLGKNVKSDRNPQAICGDSYFKTGAVYGIAPATQWAGSVLAPDGHETAEPYWNVFQIKVEGKNIEVRLNGKKSKLC